MSLLFTHLIFLLSIAASTAIAAPLCHEVLELPTSHKSMDITLDDLAKMKLQIDLKKSEGNSSPADRKFEGQYSKKKLDLQNHFKLSDQEVANMLRERIAREQSRENQGHEKQIRAQQDKAIHPWLKTKTIDLPQLNEAVNTKLISEKHHIAFYPFDKSTHELTLVDLNTGVTTTYKTTASMSDLIVPKDSDVAIAATPEGLTTFNLVTKEFKPWNKVNEWRNTVEGSTARIEQQISTMTPDQKYLVHVIYKGSTTLAAVIEIATGKIALTKELEYNNQFFQHAMMLNETKLALGGPQGLYIFDLKKEAYFVLSIQSKMETFTRTDNKRALIGEYNSFTYRFDLTNHADLKSKTHASEHLAIDSDYVWRMDIGGHLERLRVHDLSIVEQESPWETRFHPRINPLKPGLVIGTFLKDETPIAIYDSHTLQTVFDFYGQFMDDAAVIDSVAVLRDGTRILIEYSINGQQKLEIWDLNQ